MVKKLISVLCKRLNAESRPKVLPHENECLYGRKRLLLETNKNNENN